MKSKVAIVRTKPSTVLEDYHRLMNLAEYQNYISKDVDTALKINISCIFSTREVQQRPGSWKVLSGL